MVRIGTPDSPRSVVLATVLDALNRADGHSRRFHATSRAQYQDAVLAALAPTSTSPVALALASEASDSGQAGSNVIPMRSPAVKGPQPVTSGVGPYTQQPGDPARSVVLGAVVNAIAAADSDGRKARTTSVTTYVRTILSVLGSPVARPMLDSRGESTLGGDGNVVDLWPRGA